MKKEEQGNMITEWLEKNGNPEIMKQVEKEAEELELHRYSEDYANCNTTDDEFSLLKNAFIAGAEWQKERLYTEEEVYFILCEHTAELFKGSKLTLSDWFEKFKK
jgi:hypothetical protein